MCHVRRKSITDIEKEQAIEDQFDSIVIQKGKCLAEDLVGTSSTSEYNDE